MDARKDEALPNWAPPIMLLLFSAAVTAMGIRIWTLISSLIATAVVVLSLQLPRRMLLAAISTAPRDTEQTLEDNLALRQLQLRRLLATSLLIGAPFFQYFAISHINGLDEETARADQYLNPGLIAICSSLYVLNTLSQDHIQECMQLQAWYQGERAKREGADSLLERLTRLETTVAAVQRKLEGYKNALQSSIHSISRFRSGESEVELQIHQLASEVQSLRDQLHQSQGKRKMSTSREALGVLFAIEWPWNKVRRVLSLFENEPDRMTNENMLRRPSSTWSQPSSRSSTPWKGEQEYRRSSSVHSHRSKLQD
eukprot:m.54862 g.54862  ORF g.54862 m.54862 type:complete len:313 (-) comp12902_c1_seq1:65-1003(-)